LSMTLDTTKTKKVIVIETTESEAQRSATALNRVDGAEIALLSPSPLYVLQRIPEIHPYLIVIDEQVQEWMDFCRQVQQVSPGTKVVVTTARQTDEITQRATEVGATAILTKPLENLQDDLPTLFEDRPNPAPKPNFGWQNEFEPTFNNPFSSGQQQLAASSWNKGAPSYGGMNPYGQNSPYPIQSTGQDFGLAHHTMASMQGNGMMPGIPYGYGAPPRPKMIVTIYSPKGGVGKTTMSLNLAVALRKLSVEYFGEAQAFNVGLTDFDVDFGDVAASLQMTPRGSVVDWPKEEPFNPDYVKNLFTFHAPSGVAILAGPERPEMEFLLNEDQAQRVIKGMHQLFDIVVVDMGYALRKSSLLAMSMATDPLFITTPDTPAVRDMTRAKKSLEEHNIRLDKARLIVNKLPRKGRPPLSIQEVKRYIGMPIAGTVHDDPKVLNALSEGTPLTLKGSSVAAQEIEEIARKLIQEYLPEKPAKTKKNKSLFGLFRRG